MKRKMLVSVLGLILISCRGSSSALAQSAFYGASGSVTKSSLGLYGGHAEDVAIASTEHLILPRDSFTPPTAAPPGPMR